MLDAEQQMKKLVDKKRLNGIVQHLTWLQARLRHELWHEAGTIGWNVAQQWVIPIGFQQKLKSRAGLTVMRLHPWSCNATAIPWKNNERTAFYTCWYTPHHRRRCLRRMSDLPNQCAPRNWLANSAECPEQFAGLRDHKLSEWDGGDSTVPILGYFWIFLGDGIITHFSRIFHYKPSILRGTPMT